MRYFLRRLVLDSPGSIEIERADHMALRKGKRHLLTANFLEQKYDLPVEKYYEYEVELPAVARRFVIFSAVSHSSMTRQRLLLSRRIGNLFTACNMYLDRCLVHQRDVRGHDSKEVQEALQETANQYDAKLGYRAMEALRNYAQHRGFPIQ